MKVFVSLATVFAALLPLARAEEAAVIEPVAPIIQPEAAAEQFEAEEPTNAATASEEEISQRLFLLGKLLAALLL